MSGYYLFINDPKSWSIQNIVLSPCGRQFCDGAGQPMAEGKPWLPGHEARIVHQEAAWEGGPARPRGRSSSRVEQRHEQIRPRSQVWTSPFLTKSYCKPDLEDILYHKSSNGMNKYFHGLKFEPHHKYKMKNLNNDFRIKNNNKISVLYHESSNSMNKYVRGLW